MASRKQVEMLLLFFILGFITEEKFGVLHKALQTKNPIIPHKGPMTMEGRGTFPITECTTLKSRTKSSIAVQPSWAIH